MKTILLCAALLLVAGCSVNVGLGPVCKCCACASCDCVDCACCKCEKCGDCGDAACCKK